MKKKLLFLPLIVLFISGCSFEDVLFWKKKDEPSQTEEPKDDSKDSQEQEGQGEEGQGGEEEGGGSEGKEDIPVETEYTATIMTSGEDFEKTFTDRTQFDSIAGPGKLMPYFKKGLKNEDLLTSLSCDVAQAMNYSDTRVLQLGSGSSSIGYINWESKNNKIYAVEAKVLCYTKYDSYHEIWNTDSWSHFKVGSSDFELEVDSSNQPVEKTVKVEFESGVNSIKLSSSLGRVFVTQFSITWRI